ncbi:tRNA (guanine-N(7)-)-methyltransferase non-catalytic subunit wuho [Coccinella septempunctata]|uniref:tRNA (guanine-N(7)-)-methyltransferase non-catalytic subunit wuho n=1 Tax=Coccinella septempunctata TaxID=41139 RepID=UPI001D072EA4|nr:tRNA (guanine-N(7)-)-methyltransferase non-catalytic subunit wuho [Coccinella septempunctata]
MVSLKKCRDNILFNSGKKLIIFNGDNIKTVNLPEPAHNLDKRGEKNVKDINDFNISCFSVSRDHKFIAISFENKEVMIMNEYFELLRKFVVARTTSAMSFTSSNSLIVADKTGDVFLYDLKEDAMTPVLMLGHLSVVLDVALTDCEKYVITCDRDEKIRVSKFPNSYNIQSFCLGHEKFVLSVKVLQNKLISASGDGMVRFWNYLDGKQLAVLNTNDYINDHIINQFKDEMNSQDVEVFALPITDMQCFSTENYIYIGISLFGYQKLLLFSLNPVSLKVNFCKHVYIGESFSFYLDDNLLFLTKTNILCLKLENDNYKGEVQNLIDIDDVHDLHLKSAFDIGLFYKKKFDNVEEYIERKKARLKLK